MQKDNKKSETREKDKKEKELKKANKIKKEIKKQETILEVNEITKESLEAEALEMLEKEKKEKEKADRLRKEKIKRNLNKVLRGYDINNIVKLIMWIFFAIISIYVNFSILRQNFSSPVLKVFIAEESLQEVKEIKTNNIDNINIKLDSFDVNIRESESENIVIRYSKKYDKKVKIEKINKSLNIEEKNKIFKLVRFDSSDNVMIIEIPKKYKGSLEIQSKNGLIKLDKYKILNEKINTEDTLNYYKNFFNI